MGVLSGCFNCTAWQQHFLCRLVEKTTPAKFLCTPQLGANCPPPFSNLRCRVELPELFVEIEREMPNIKSAKKRLRQNIATRDRNRSSRSFVRNRCKNVVKAITTGNIDEAKELFRQAVKVLDQAGAKRIIHKNAAARKKSRLSAMIKKLESQQTAG